MSAENFLKSLSSGFPETLKSNESSNVYHLIAEKDGQKLGVSATLETGYPCKHKGMKLLSVAIVLRFIVTGKTESTFPSIKTRAVAVFNAPNGDAVAVLRGDKLYLPVTYYPVGPAELMQAIAAQNVYARLGQYDKGKVEADGGTMLFPDNVVQQALASKFEDVPTETLHLFALPGEVVTDEPAETQDNAAGSESQTKDAIGKIVDEGLDHLPPSIKPAVIKKLGLGKDDKPSDGPNILPGGDDGPNPDDEDADDEFGK